MLRVVSRLTMLVALTIIAVGIFPSVSRSETDAADCVTTQSQPLPGTDKKDRSLAVARCPGAEYVLFVANQTVPSGRQVASVDSKEFEPYRLQVRPPQSLDISVGNCVRSGKAISAPLIVLAQWGGRGKISLGQGLVSIFAVNMANKSFQSIDIKNISCYSDNP